MLEQDNPYEPPQPPVPRRQLSPIVIYSIAALLTIALISLTLLQRSARFRWSIEKAFSADLWKGDPWD
jgi:hypothetical protein